MDKTTMAKAVTAVITGLATIAGVVFSVNVDWLTPELAVSIGAGVTALMVWLVPNEPVE